MILLSCISSELLIGMCNASPYPLDLICNMQLCASTARFALNQPYHSAACYPSGQ
ncbi:hypothetical protein PF008_g5367 [Phytophthora fragariae]|uniref:Uncharacterized protein n=1 Tax=Phytophthora fragariae TaxID=53985 RepID=A0A6G0SAF9_9STRA|nr:hypothetical protein PF008_g5367 [Phytophthora fragariae]